MSKRILSSEFCQQEKVEENKHVLFACVLIINYAVVSFSKIPMDKLARY